MVLKGIADESAPTVDPGSVAGAWWSRMVLKGIADESAPTVDPVRVDSSAQYTACPSSG
jgi:hypothetical protein